MTNAGSKNSEAAEFKPFEGVVCWESVLAGLGLESDTPQAAQELIERTVAAIDECVAQQDEVVPMDPITKHDKVTALSGFEADKAALGKKSALVSLLAAGDFPYRVIPVEKEHYITSELMTAIRTKVTVSIVEISGPEGQTYQLPATWLDLRDARTRAAAEGQFHV